MDLQLARRRFLFRSAIGVGSMALGELLANDAASNPLAARKPQFAPKAKSCIFLTMLGGVGQMDSFDPKPKLTQLTDTVMDWSKETRADQPGLYSKPRYLTRSPWKFQKYGQSGMDVSELFPHTAKVVDELAFVRSVRAPNGNHPAAVFHMNTGHVIPGRPSMGAWLTFGLGSENQDLPGFVVLPDPNSLTFSGSQQWSNGFLPASYQGTSLNWKGEPIRYLSSPKDVSKDLLGGSRDLLRSINRQHLEDHFTNPQLQARIDAYELAYRMQAAVPGVLDVQKESDAVREMYGITAEATESFGTRCLMARKLVENGVRFVQLYTETQAWDSHGNMLEGHGKAALQTDKPIAALIQDLKQRGLLNRTLVVWMGEFGRTPDRPQKEAARAGRDHNIEAMTMWFAGAGIKAGTVAGATDEIGFKAIESPYEIHDVHATILHLMGLDHERLTYYHSGRNMRLTDVAGKLMRPILA